MLEVLCKNHELWIKMALQISKDKELSNDLVQDMYLKLHKANKDISEGYVYFTIKSIFLDLKKKKSEVVKEESYFSHLKSNETDYEKESDFEFKINKINKAYSELKPIEQLVVEKSYEIGFRKLSRESGIGIGTINRYRNRFKDKL